MPVKAGMTILGIILTGAFLVAGLALLAWTVRGDPPRGRRRCPICWYDMSGDRLTCPECGRTATREAALFRTRRRWRRAMLALLLLALVPAVFYGDRFRTSGWAAMPRTLVLLSLPLGDLRQTATGTTAADIERSYVMAFARQSQSELASWQRRWTVWALGRKLRRAPEAENRALAAVYLSLLWRTGAALDRGILIRALDDNDAEVERCAAMTLFEIALDDQSLDPTWLRLLREGRHDASRDVAASVLGLRLRAGDHSHMPALLAALAVARADPQVQQGSSIGSITTAIARSRTEAGLAALMAMLNSDEAFERFIAAYAMAEMGDSAAPAVPVLVRHLQRDSSLDSLVFVRAIAAIGPAARDAVPLLIERLQHPQDVYGHRCMRALSRIGVGDPRVTDALAVQLQSTRSGYSRSAAEALAALDWRATEHRAILESMLEDENIRLYAGLILARTDGRVQDFVAELIRIVGDDSIEIWNIERAIETLGMLGPEAAPAVPVLKKICPPRPRGGFDENTSRRYEAASAALRRISPADAPPH
jgi:hypothetical protein